MDYEDFVVEERESLYPWVILGILTLAQLVMSMGAYVWGPLAPVLRDSYNLSRAQIGTITSALYFTSVMVAIPSGLAVDRIGARILLIVSLIVMGIPFAVMALAKNYAHLLVLAAIGGLGYGMVNQISTKGIMYWFSAKLRATAMGIKQTGVTLGGAIIAVLLPALSALYNWRLGVLVVSILMLVMAMVSLFCYKERPAVSPEVGGERAFEPARKREKGSLKRVMANPLLIILCFLTPLMAFGQTCIASFLILYLEEDIHFTSGLAGACLTAAMIAGTVGRIGWGVLSDRVFSGDRIRPLIILSVVALIGTLGMAFLNKSSAVWLPFLYSVLMGGTFMGWNGVLITLAAELAGHELAGSIMGILVTIAWTGIIIGPPVFGFIADEMGYYWGWMTVAAFTIIFNIGFIYLIRLSKTRSKEGQASE
ncbi:MAG: MFS transporter [Thermodesulfobacteriota bacterium]|nr:MFS transporter [Thermodesulfobacteriota bacterium]